PPIVVEGQQVGTALVRSTGSGLTAADRSLKIALLRAIAGAAGLAALLAMLTGLAVARRITRPVIRLIAATRAMAAGDRAARVGEIHAAGELRELAAAFDQMAGTLDRQEQIRRDLAASPVLADAHWLHQVITNLLTNALKFTPAGGRVTISTERTGADAILRVTDTGAGISAEDLPRIFDRFFRGQQAAQISGSGIGLTVAAELVQAHGGRLTAASELGHGTQMTLSLPSA